MVVLGILRLADEASRVAASRATFGLAHLRGRYSNQLACIGYPKSGTSWLAKMLSSALEVPEPSFYRMPILRPAILHGHRFTGRGLPTIYVARDPRDVFVSMYFHRCRMLALPENPRYRQALSQRYEVLPKPLEPQWVDANIGDFVRLELESPRDSRVPWAEHSKWAADELAAGRDRFAEVRYEDLLREPVSVLASALETVGYPRPMSRIESAVEVNAFETLSGGRTQGEVDELSFYRSGAAGTWSAVLSRDLADEIGAAFEPQMRRHGYVH